jgi:adenylate kinase family enzyme
MVDREGDARMKRFVVMTVGKTHSGKTTFARALEQQLHNSLVIDQDNHAEFINAYYKALQPKQGPNALKYALTQTIVDYAVTRTDSHLILCNSNRSRRGRLEVLEHFHNEGFISVLVNFDLPDEVLYARVADSQRSTAIFRRASSFAEVLHRQIADSHKDDAAAPVEGEADHLYVISDSAEVPAVIRSIVELVRML